MSTMARMMETLSTKHVFKSPLCTAKGLGSPAVVPVLRVRSRRSRGKVQCMKQDLEGTTMTPAPKSCERTQYNDSWLERKSIHFLTKRMERMTGKTTELEGYDGFVDITKKMVHGHNASSQQATVHQILSTVLPSWLLSSIRRMPKTKWMTESYALFTVIFFKWLVGESEIREQEVNGEVMKSTVYIKKCRYLESSQCVGLCVNLCKFPTQDFIGEQFGMPLTMKPNFEDMSCEMMYGVQPPRKEEDDAYRQPCYSMCKTAKEKPKCS
ncbi:hypothetical protein R1sor_004369 [Riccia sorocarpa]|uniref:Beta-carotene isomerase D27-like C-terminal domain-containing protein n=1 Tax=Riccia sorocarpa TaxID=122646 RepID=A0ABD3HH56_9MARC